MDHYTEFISLIHDFIDLFRSLTTVEQQKLDAAVANDLSILEDCMKKEQAFVLRLRGLEQQRDTLLRKLKMKDLKFREILSRVPDENSLLYFRNFPKKCVYSNRSMQAHRMRSL